MTYLSTKNNLKNNSIEICKLKLTIKEKNNQIGDKLLKRMICNNVVFDQNQNKLLCVFFAVKTVFQKLSFMALNLEIN